MLVTCVSMKAFDTMASSLNTSSTLALVSSTWPVREAFGLRHYSLVAMYPLAFAMARPTQFKIVQDNGILRTIYKPN